jgi:hypothetical protein
MQGVHELNGEAESGQTSAPPVSAQDSPKSGSEGKIASVILALIFVATLGAYSPVLFNFFNGDDYVHLTWLANAIHQPELIWRNFYTSWLDGTTTKFYRPLISVFMVSDYAIWGVNGLGFRLTNIAFHLSASTFIYFIVSNLQETLKQTASISGAESNQTPDQNKRRLSELCWPAAAAALFALHPLHPEAVAWITGRVDSIVTAFCTAAIYFYIKWRRTERNRFAAVAAVSMILGLLSKEMAITLPAVFLWAELVYGGCWVNRSKAVVSAPLSWADGTSTLHTAAAQEHLDKMQPITTEDAGSGSKVHSNKSRITDLFAVARRCVVKTAPFWIILAAYFGVRYFALGTFVGGYDDSLFFISNMKEFISGWLHALTTLVVPINRSLMGSHHWISKIWPATLAATGILIAINLAVDSKVRRHALFQLGWLALCLIPVYKLFNIAPDLQGSRLAYLATVPVCISLALSIYPCARLTQRAWYQISQILAISALLLLSTYLLWNNNLPWRAAGQETTRIQNELRSLFSTIDGDPQTLFLGLPDQIDGAYTCRNALDGMTKKPQLQRDIRNCLMVNAFEPILPFGFLKESIAENNKEILIYRWENENKKFQKVEISKPSDDSFKSWSGAQLREILSVPEQKFKPSLNFAGQNPELSSSQNSGEIEIDFGSLACFSTEYVILKATLDRPAEAETGLDLLYSNDMYPTFELRRRAHATYKKGEQKQTLIFGLRGLPEWSLGGNTHKFRLLVPPGCKFQINSLEVAAPGFVTPLISFSNSGYLGTKGYLHLGPDKLEQQLNVSVRQIPQARSYELEITRANLLFESQNGQTRSKVGWKLIKGDSKEGQTTLRFNDFRTPGIYEIRAWALDEHGTVCGAASDHIVLSVDPATK